MSAWTINAPQTAELQPVPMGVPRMAGSALALLRLLNGPPQAVSDSALPVSIPEPLGPAGH